MTAADAAWNETRRGSHDGFRAWLAYAEPLLWRNLRSFARTVDIEAIVQEALSRMWVLAPTLELAGDDASLRFVQRLARNLAISESRRRRHERPLGEEGGPPADTGEWAQHGDEQETSSPPAPPPDPSLRAAILRCLGSLPGQPRRALQARLKSAGGGPDRVLAESLGMSLNTFLQNVTRARRLVRECLERAGYRLEEIWR